MLALLVLVFIASKVESQDTPELVYNQSIYQHIFETDGKFGKYDKNSPPLRKDDMTRYTDGMEEFNNDIDKFVDHHCEPYINFLESKLLKTIVVEFKILNRDYIESILSTSLKCYSWFFR